MERAAIDERHSGKTAGSACAAEIVRARLVLPRPRDRQQRLWIDPEHDLVVVRWIDKASLDGLRARVRESVTG
jgi:hypothetical protein